MSNFDPFPGPDEPFNPYESPRTSLGRPDWAVEKARGTSVPFEVGPIFSRSWEIFKSQWGLAIGIVVGCTVLNLIAQNLPGLIAGLVGGVGGAVAAAPGAGGGANLPAMNNAAQTQIAITMFAVLGVLGVAAFVFQLWINIGQTLVFLRIAQGREASFGDVFRGGRYIFRYILASIILGLVVTVGTAIGAIPGAIAAVSGAIEDDQTKMLLVLLGVLVAFAVMLIFLVRWSQYYYLIVDRDAGATESLRMSSEITRGRLWGLGGLWLLAALVNLGGAVACLVGLVVTVPFTLILFAVAYQSLSGGPVADPLGYGKPPGAGDLLLE